jgi:hypothetical protein
MKLPLRRSGTGAPDNRIGSRERSKVSHPRTAPDFGSWSVPEVPLTIEYSLDVLEQVRAAATDGLRQLSRGGLEVGGVLFGTRGANSIHITRWRPIPCEYARGPAFLLSQNDRIALGQLLQNAKQDPDLNELHPLGWFVSHTKNGLTMLESDLKIFEHYFPWSWQITLVLNPSRPGVAEAGFFVRDANGNLKSDASYRTFTIAPAVRAQVVRRPVSRLDYADVREQPTQTPVRSELLDQPESEGAVAPPLPARHRALTGRRALIWAVPVLLAIIVLSLMWERNTSPPKPPTFAFRASDTSGEMKIEWDKNAEPIRNAARGTLEINDGDSPLLVALDTQRLRKGSFIYPRKSGDIELRMTVYPASGLPLQEFAKFVGPRVTRPPAPIVNVDETAQLREERDHLRTEAERLRESLRKESARVRELEEVVRILQNRREVEKLKVPEK